MATAARAHSLILRSSLLVVRTEAHHIPTRPYMLLGLQHYELPRTEEAFPLCELGTVDVLPPQPHGTNGWCHTLVVRDCSDVVVCSIDHYKARVLCGFADALRERIAVARSRPTLPEPLLDAYRWYASTSWLALERARHGIPPPYVVASVAPSVAPGYLEAGQAAMSQAAMGQAAVGQAAMGQVAMGQPLERLSVEMGAPVEVSVPAAPAPQAMARAGIGPPESVASGHGVFVQEGGGKMSEPLLGKGGGSLPSDQGASAEPSGMHAPPPPPPPPPLVQSEAFALQVPPGAGGGSPMTFSLPDGRQMTVMIPPGLVAGEMFQILVPNAVPTSPVAQPPTYVVGHL